MATNKRNPTRKSMMLNIHKKKLAMVVGLIISGHAFAAYDEAPILQQQVKTGALPEVQNRLPKEPLVIEPIDSIGEYGGQLNLLSLKRNIGLDMRLMKYDNLFNFNRSYTGIEPNIATSFEVNPELTEYTVKLREGIKWSDGVEFTPEDIKFYIDLVSREDWSGNKPAYIPVTAEVLDKYTVKFKLEKPDGMFIRKLANTDGSNIVQFPKHYCEQYLPEVNPKVRDEAKKAGFESWQQYFQTKCRAHYFPEHYSNPDRPTVNAWKIKVPASPKTQYALWERNPYYWVVDSEGNQLPYLDNVYISYSENKEELVLRAAAGETDFQTRFVGEPKYRSMFIENENKGNYKYKLRPTTSSNALILGLNQTIKDPIKRELYQKKAFRIALSHAIDREGISEAVYSGAVEPWQVAPIPGSEFYNEEFGTQYLAYDPDKANKLLDELGLNKRDNEGFRLDKTGKRLRIDTLIDQRLAGERTDMLELIKNDWAKVGIFMDMKISEGSYVLTQRLANEHDLIPNTGDGGIGVLDTYRNYAPQNPESTWATAYYYWSTDKSHNLAEKPQGAIAKQFQLLEAMANTASQTEQNKLMHQVVDVAKDEFYLIGTVRALDEGVIIKNDVRNSDTSVPHSYGIASPGPMRPAQLWKQK